MTIESDQLFPVALVPLFASSQCTTRLEPDWSPVAGSTATLTTWRSGVSPRIESCVTLDELLLSAVPAALYSPMEFEESVVTVNWMLPTPGGPSGRVNAN